MKERLGITEMRKTANRMNFGDVSSRELHVALALICEGFSFLTLFLFDMNRKLDLDSTCSA